MGLTVTLNHKTEYRYDRPIQLGPQLVRLKPAAHARTQVSSWALKVGPQKHFINSLQDPYGNFLTRILFPERTDHFSLEVNLTADLTVFNPFDFFLEPECETWPMAWSDMQRQSWTPWLKKAEHGPLFSRFLKAIPTARTQTIPFLVDVNQRIAQAVSYRIRLEPNIQTPEETLRLASGSCRDSALLLVELLRHLDLPARFVSGYLIQLKPDQRPLQAPYGPSEDFTDLHAWAEVFIPGAGWIGLDPTSGLLTGEGHIPLAATPDPSEAAPVSGLLEPCESSFHHSMTTSRIPEAPRPTKPFPAGGEEALDQVGRSVDARLARLGCRLTMGGEPTFVSETDREGLEWISEAQGPTKKTIGYQLLGRLAARWAPGGVFVTKQGKWYPGETLPRWALSCYWVPGRKLWQNTQWLADASRPGVTPAEMAETFLHSLAKRLGVSEAYILPAFEDPLTLLKEERDIPLNLNPGDQRLADSEERRRLAQVLTRGPHKPSGYVLPLEKGSWKSGPWPTRAGRLTLLPGDSPVGLRLPLDSLPWAAPGEDRAFFEADPFAGTVRQSGRKVAPLKTEAGPAAQVIAEQALPPGPPALVEGQSAAWVVRTALTTQVRDGHLYVFFPPFRKAQDWAELAAEVEKTAGALQVPVVLEGYPPAFDPEWQHLQITPDPGVLEINLPPAGTWPEWKARLEGLWEEARLCGLSTEKYLVGGQTVGTGGGCHWVLGGPTPADSPFIKNPGLLRSWVVYLNKHPSLSYVFAGLFIGPTSQAPRYDEAHPQSLNDLKLALQSLKSTPDPAPWISDRVFRHLLTDGTGNTHRTELCIDKLYSPGGPSGRLGLVEFRSFEMAAHPQTALAQSLLLRALTLRFLEHPETDGLKDWGCALTDQWMLPHFLEEDLRQVLKDLSDLGLALPWEPFAAHLSFRFPLIGTLRWQGLHLELRTALEPWPVTGEEPGAGGTVRYVDSSVERLQVEALAWQPERYALVCRGHLVPLKQTPRGTWVAGIRYKAWNLASGLHPLLPADPVVVLEVFDLAAGKIVAGLTYFAAHPAGRNYETPPVNAFEAEARRSARFRTEILGGGSLASAPRLAVSKDFPHTLDLRYL